MPRPYAKPSRKGSQQDGQLLTLVRHGLIAAGDTLVYERPRRGDSFTATVTDDGWLALSEGRKARSPSGAIKLLVGTTDNGFKACWVSSGRLSCTPNRITVDPTRLMITESVYRNT